MIEIEKKDKRKNYKFGTSLKKKIRLNTVFRNSYKRILSVIQ